MSVRGRGTQLEVARIQSEINRLFETLLRLRGGEQAATGSWTPGVDVAETNEELIVEIDLPGLEPGSLRVTAENGNLSVEGIRLPPPARDLPGAEVLHDEREFGPFQLAVPLYVAVNTHRAQSTLKAGVFRVVLPKVPNRRGAPVTIPVPHEE